MALFTLKISFWFVAVLSLTNSPFQLVEGKKNVRFGAQLAVVNNVQQRELRGDCEDSDTFRYEGNPEWSCDSYVAEKPNKRCKKEQPDSGGKAIRFFCPGTCKSKCKNTDSPSSSPTVKRKTCENSETFRFQGNPEWTCDSFVAEKPNKRCKKEQPDSGGKKINFFCPSTCKSRCKRTDSPTSSPTVKRGKCENSETFRFQGKPEWTCDSYVAEKPNKRCDKEQPDTDGTLVKDFCPATCKNRCKRTDSPTSSPTTKPTSTDAPTKLTPLVTTSAPSISTVPTLSPTSTDLPTGTDSPTTGTPTSVSDAPTASISDAPTASISDAPSDVPTGTSEVPTSTPTTSPTLSSYPSLSPTDKASSGPSDSSSVPSSDPSSEPSGSFFPSSAPSDSPSDSSYPSLGPTGATNTIAV